MKEKILHNLLYEIVERIIRFILHLEEIEAQFYNDRSKHEVMAELIDNYKKVLYDLLNTTIIKYSNDIHTTEKYSILFKALIEIMEMVNKLHIEYLSILPRPIEPVELLRFVRVIHNQILQLTDPSKKKKISISLNEEIGETVNNDYLSEYKKRMKEIVNTILKNEIPNEKDLSIIDSKQHNQHERLHITIPRIDGSNTFRWPSLIHEVCRSLIKEIKFEKGDIEKDFLDHIGDERKNAFQDFFNVKDPETNISKLTYWLQECWCDLFSCILIGPSFYFSQYILFLNVKYKTETTHPPHLFRLALMESIIQHRFPELHKVILEKNYIPECDELLESQTLLLDDGPRNTFKERSILISIYVSFNNYFLSHFLTKMRGDDITLSGDNQEINGKLNTLINKYVRIHPSVIDFLLQRLNQGLPIPSVKTRNINNKYEELPAYVQEIFLTSWLSRHDSLMPGVLKEIDGIIKGKNEIYQKSTLSQNIEFYQNIKKMIVRHDQAVLKSIQVSEWFDFLIEKKCRPEKITIFNTKVHSRNKLKRKTSGIYVDSEIEKLIIQDELKIIPIIMYKDQESKSKITSQIGTTSVDIRLGTSFQIFYPDQYGLIDYTAGNEFQNFVPVSTRINLDFVEGITIIPGQFLLGHSMEYIKLPDYICGNLEGRSSFARWGIEIHMTASYIDPGFEGALTFEIYNAGNAAVKLYPGMRVGQIRFERNKIPKETYSKKHTVKYKGLLEHDISRQNKDFEVELIRKYNLQKQGQKDKDHYI